MRVRPFIYLFIMLSLLTACTLRASTATPQVIQNPAYTSAAETINAQLTDIALPAGTAAPEQQAVRTTPESPAESSTPVQITQASPEPVNTEAALPTEMPTSTDTPIPTTAPQVAFATEDPRYNLGQADWQDTFTDAANWPIYSDEHVEMEVWDGNLSMTALNADKYEAWMLTQDWISDVYLEAKVTTGTCSGMDRYGLMVRAQSANQGYLFGFTCDGRYAIRNWNGQTFLLLTQWKASEHIQSGPNQSNVIGVRLLGDQVSLYANGQLLTQISDTSYTSGGFGPFVSAYETPGFNVEFSEINYWVIE